jgi:hypothetical protein
MAQGLTTPGAGAQTKIPQNITELSIIFLHPIQMQNLWL